MSAPPRLSRGVTITRRQIGPDECYYLVKNPRDGSFLRMGEAEVALLRLLDGSRPLDEVATILSRTHDFTIETAEIERFVATLMRRGLIESRDFDPAAFREEWMTQQRARRRTLGQMFGTLTYLKAHLFNPRRFFSMVVGPLGFCWSPVFVVATSVLMVLAGTMSFLERGEILRSAHALYVSATATPGSLVQHAVLFYLVLFLVVAIHELAHGLTCAHFGGDVTDMGFILFYLQVPGMYCDITDAYSFERRSHRLWTTFAGSYTGLLLASLGFFGWCTSEAGDLLNTVGILLMFVGGPPALAFNWNPLLRLDGYYMLMDFLEAPNLMDNSYRYLGYVIKTRLLRLRAEPTNVPRRLRRPFVIYGLCSFLFLAPWIIYMPFVAYYLFSSVFGQLLAFPIATVIAWRLLSRPVAKVVDTARYAWLSHRPAVLSGQHGGARAALLGLGAAAAGLLMLMGPRFAVRADGLGLLEPIDRYDVRAAWPGFVSAATPAPREGDRVNPGDLLARLENPELQAELSAATFEASSLVLARESVEARGDPAGVAVARLQEKAATERASILSERLASLDLKSSIAGVVLTPRLEDRAGAYLQAGETWCQIGRLDQLRVRVQLTERDLGLITVDSPAEVKGEHLPGAIFAGRVTRLPAGRRPTMTGPDPMRATAILTAGATTAATPGAGVSGSLDVDVAVDNQAGLLRPGMTARVRIYGERLTLAEHTVRWVRRLVKGKIWW